MEGRYAPDFWLHLEAKAKASLADLDDFLREVWLECCGHMSAFDIGGASFDSSGKGGMVWGDEDSAAREEAMAVPLGHVLRLGLKFRYQYDFGSTTELALRVIGELESNAGKEPVRLLARNNPPPFVCDECGMPAAHICTDCAGSGGGWLCAACVSEHGCGEEMLLPVVNSPRVGVCGYTG